MELSEDWMKDWSNWVFSRVEREWKGWEEAWERIERRNVRNLGRRGENFWGG